MSIQSEWQPASQKEPAKFELDYTEIKVQAVKNEAGEIQVRLSTSFNCDWQMQAFDKWYEEIDGHSDSAFEAAYQLLKKLRPAVGSADDLALLNALITEIESRNPGLIRG